MKSVQNPQKKKKTMKSMHNQVTNNEIHAKFVKRKTNEIRAEPTKQTMQSMRNPPKDNAIHAKPIKKKQ